MNNTWHPGPAVRSARRPVAGRIALYGTVIVLAALFLLPFYIVLRNAFATHAEITASAWVWFPPKPTLDNLTGMFAGERPILAISMANSLIVAIAQTALQLLFASMAGYALARIPIRCGKAVLGYILLPMMIPGAVTFVPSFVLVAYFGWVNSFLGLVIPGAFSVFATLVFRQFYLDFPRDLEEAARVDGLGTWGIFWHIVVPNSQGAFVSMGILVFVGSWNSFLWPLVIAQDQNMYTVQMYVSSFLTSQNPDLPKLFMAALVSVLPIAVLFLALQRYIVGGITRSGIKG